MALRKKTTVIGQCCRNWFRPLPGIPLNARSGNNRQSRKGVTLVEMAVVIFIIAAMLGIVGSFINNLAFLKTSDDEATILKDTIGFARQAARRSGRPVYIEFDLDEDAYRVFRIDRSKPEAEEERLAGPRNLSGFNTIVSAMTAAGTRIESGKLKIAFDPFGVGEELIIHLGSSSGDIKKSVQISRYGDETRILEGEAELNLEKPEWREDLESW